MLVNSYCNFDKKINFAYSWSFIGKGLHLQPAQEACFSQFFLYIGRNDIEGFYF